MTKPWYDFQEEICTHFKSLGFDAETNKTIEGVRTNHDIDIYVKTKFLGQNLKWIIEAKKWKSKVNKLQVFGLITIVNEIGADKGFIISENGFQKGAIEAIKNTNITLLTFEELKTLTIEYTHSEQLKSYEKRIENIYERYFTHSKKVRKKYGLRGELGDFNLPFSVPWILMTANQAIREAKRAEFPINLDTHLSEKYGNIMAENFQQFINWLNLNLNIVDSKTLEIEKNMRENGDYNSR